MPYLIHEIFADDVITQCVKIIEKRHNLRKEDIFLRLLYNDQRVGIGIKKSGFEPGWLRYIAFFGIHVL